MGNQFSLSLKCSVICVIMKRLTGDINEVLCIEMNRCNNTCFPYHIDRDTIYHTDVGNSPQPAAAITT